jgi:hypothetical protein
MLGAALFLLAIYIGKMRNKNSKFIKESDFGGFQLPEVRGKKK